MHNPKRFEYQHKDIGYLKKDIAFRTIFSVLFIGIFVWQIVNMFMGFSSITQNLQIVTSIIVLISCLMLAFVSLTFVFKDFRIISAIKNNGKCVSSVQLLVQTKKRSFIWLYSLLIKFFTLVTSLVLIASVTYTILEVTFLSSISFFMPFLFMICLSGFNSIYHIKDEIHTQNYVQEQQPLY